jgi:hypothetical protein
MMADNSDDVSYIVGRIYERHKDKDDDPIKYIAQAIGHIYRKFDELDDKISALSDRIDDLESMG